MQNVECKRSVHFYILNFTFYIFRFYPLGASVSMKKSIPKTGLLSM